MREYLKSFLVGVLITIYSIMSLHFWSSLGLSEVSSILLSSSIFLLYGLLRISYAKYQGKRKDPFYISKAESEAMSEQKKKYDEEIERIATSPIVIPGRGVTCMIPGKYSREYTDYFLNQLADFFGFGFFKNRIYDLQLEPNQRLQLMREYLENKVKRTGSKRWLSPYLAIDAAEFCVESCENGEISKHALQDMMFFDGLILNDKRSLDNFGFIVDKEKKDEDGNALRYAFVCFYDDYSSFFDHLNGLSFEQRQDAIHTVMSWTHWHLECTYATDQAVRYLCERYREPLTRIHISFGNEDVFHDNEQFKLDDFIYVKELDETMSMYKFQLISDASRLLQILNSRQRRLELLQDPKKLEAFNKEFESRPLTAEDRKKLEKKERYEAIEWRRRKHLEALAKQEHDIQAKKYNEEKMQYRLKHPESVVDPETLSLFELFELSGELEHYHDMTRHNGIKSFTWRESDLIRCIRHRKDEELEIEELESKASLTEDEYEDLLRSREYRDRLIEEQKKLEESLEFYRDIRKKRDPEHIKECDRRNREQNLKYREKEKLKAEYLNKKWSSS